MRDVFCLPFIPDASLLALNPRPGGPTQTLVGKDGTLVLLSSLGPVGPGRGSAAPPAGALGKHFVCCFNRVGLAFFCRVCEAVVARATSWCRGPVICVRRHDHEDPTVNTPEPNPDSFLPGPEGRHKNCRWRQPPVGYPPSDGLRHQRFPGETLAIPHPRIAIIHRMKWV